MNHCQWNQSHKNIFKVKHLQSISPKIFYAYGIPLSEMPRIWNFLFTQNLQTKNTEDTKIRGFGVVIFFVAFQIPGIFKAVQL